MQHQCGRHQEHAGGYKASIWATETLQVQARTTERCGEGEGGTIMGGRKGALPGEGGIPAAYDPAGGPPAAAAPPLLSAAAPAAAAAAPPPPLAAKGFCSASLTRSCSI